MRLPGRVAYDVEGDDRASVADCRPLVRTHHRVDVLFRISAEVAAGFASCRLDAFQGLHNHGLRLTVISFYVGGSGPQNSGLEPGKICRSYMLQYGSMGITNGTTVSKPGLARSPLFSGSFVRRPIARERTPATRHRQNTPSSIANRNAASFRRSAETIVAPEDGPDRAGCTTDRKPVRFAI